MVVTLSVSCLFGFPSGCDETVWLFTEVIIKLSGGFVSSALTIIMVLSMGMHGFVYMSV